MPEPMMQVSIPQIVRTVAGAMKRERTRIVTVLVGEQRRLEAAGLTAEAAALANAIELVVAPPAGIALTQSQPTPVAPHEPEPVEDELPPVRTLDDEEEGVFLARQRLARRE